MPWQNVTWYDFNLYNLIHEIYTNIDLGALAHRMVDEGLCDLKYFVGGNLAHMHQTDGHSDNIQACVTADIDSEVVRATLASITNTYTLINGNISITGWRSGIEKVIVLYRKDKRTKAS